MHGLNTLSYLNANAEAAAHNRAADPGNTRARSAEARLMEALAHVADVLEYIAEEADTPQAENIRRARAPAPEWSVVRHGDEYWVLPLTGQARSLAQAIIPPGVRRYGMHYILPADDLVNQAIIESIQEAQNA